MRYRKVPGYLRKEKAVLTGMFFLLCVILSGGYVSAAESKAIQTTEMKTEPEVTQTEEGPVFYTALGDSIPNGYYGAQEPEVTAYPVLIAGDLRKISGREIWMSRFTKNGLTTKKLNSKILSEPGTQELLAQADVITLTIGSNDLMNEFKKVSREILNNETRFLTADEALVALQEGIAENPLLLMSVATAIGGWDYEAFEEQWVLAMETIREYRKADAQMAVTTIYNPMEGQELPGTLNAVVESVISGMNEIMWNHAEAYDYRVVDLFDSGIEELTQSDGLHPNQAGQDMIRMLTENELELSVFQSRETDEEVLRMQKELEEAAEKKALEAEQKRQQVRRKRILMGVSVGAAVLLVFAGIFVIIRKRKRKKTTAEKGVEKE